MQPAFFGWPRTLALCEAGDSYSPWFSLELTVYQSDAGSCNFSFPFLDGHVRTPVPKVPFPVFLLAFWGRGFLGLFFSLRSTGGRNSSAQESFASVKPFHRTDYTPLVWSAFLIVMRDRNRAPPGKPPPSQFFHLILMPSRDGCRSFDSCVAMPLSIHLFLCGSSVLDS